VYIDYKLSHQAEILNRIAVEVTSDTEGKGHHKAIFQTSERATGGVQRNDGQSFEWEREYDSEFDRDRLGYVTIDKKYFMPVVRNVPVFPGRNLKPGEKWIAEGHEVHDFRDSFGIQEPYRIPFIANYVFLGERTWKGKSYPAFSVSYQINAAPKAVTGKLWPKRIMGSSNQTIYWDAALGQAAAYQEDFRMTFNLSNNKTVEYRGKAEAELIESASMDKEKMIEEIQEELERLNISDATVKAADEGITISMEDIQFEAETAVMLPGEQVKLDKIAEILRRYSERDILVSGHTALAGTAAGRMKLSVDRAKVIAEHLISRKVRSADRIVVRGYGAERPVAGNDTEEGRRKNRRVEITLLEN
jgi:outer membrane protein OmpA-like peptidoglycan-associated protein